MFLEVLRLDHRCGRSDSHQGTVHTQLCAYIVKSLNFKLLLLLITSIFCYVCIICYIYFVTEVYTYVWSTCIYYLCMCTHVPSNVGLQFAKVPVPGTGNIFGQLYIHVSKQLTINNLYLWGLFNPGK